VELHVIFGTGPVGSEAARLLLAKGRRVKMINRTGRLPELLADLPGDMASRLEMAGADAMDPGAVAAACSGASHVYHCANVPYEDWQRVLPTMNANMIAAARGAGAALAYAENLYMYARGAAVINEQTPVDPPSRKGMLRQKLHQELVDAGTKHGLRWVTVRASDFYGPGATAQSVFGTERFLDVMYAGKRPQLLGDSDMPHTYTYVGDYGRALVEAALTPAAHGRAWIVPNDRTLTTREVAALFFKAAGREGKVGRIPRAFITAASPFIPLLREVREVLHQKEEAYVVDGSSFQARFAFVPTTLEEGIRRTIEWYEERRTRITRAA
jgi:nucleoside-diphosphate-sugar epimerase